MLVIDALKDTFYKQELNSFLNSFVTTQAKINAGQAPPTAPTSPEQVLQDIQGLWKNNDNPPLHPAELREALVEKYMPSTDERLLKIYNEVERSRYEPDAMTGFMQKPHLGLVSGLGHLYAQSTGGNVAMIEVDYSNMGGTNELYRAMEAAAQGVPVEDIPVEEVWKYTDDSAKLIAKTMQSELQDILPEGGKILPVRSGGDELRLIVTGIEPSQYETISRHIHSKIEAHMATLDLHDHKHLKAPGNDVKNGFGAAFTIIDMNELDPAHAVELADEDIKAKKIELGHMRLGTVDEAQTRQTFAEYFEKHPDKIPQGMNAEQAVGFLVEREKLHSETKNAQYGDLKDKTGKSAQAKADYIKQQVDALDIDEAKATGLVQSDYIENDAAGKKLFAPPAEQRAMAVQDKITENGIQVANDYEARYLQQLTQSTTAIDPSAQVYMPNDLPATTEIYAKDTEKLKAQMLSENTGLDPKKINSMKPQMMGVSFHNLGGLNDAVGHDGANVILKYMSTDIIGEALKQEGIMPEDYQIAHYGGAEFQILVKPAISGDGEYKIIDEDIMQRVQNNVEMRTNVLQNTNIVEFLTEKGMPPTAETQTALSDKTFASISDVKPDRNISGIFAVTNNTPVEYAPGDRAGKIIHDHRQNLENNIDERRTALIEQRDLPSKPSYSLALEVAGEIDRVVGDLPNAAQLIGGDTVLSQTINNIMKMDTTFEERGGVLFQTGGNAFETGQTFTDIHVADYRENGRPSLVAQAVEFAEEIGLDTNSPEYKAMILVATRAEVESSINPDYHNKHHYSDVTAYMGKYMQRNNELAAENPNIRAYTPEQMALGFTMAIGHDLDHPGKGNPQDDMFFNERASFEEMRPLLKEAGLSQDQIEQGKIMVLGTSPIKVDHIVREVTLAHHEGRTVDWNELDPEGKFTELRPLMDDPVLAEMTSNLTNADLSPSSVSMKSNIEMSKILTNEVQAAGVNMNFNGDGARSFFLGNLVGEDGFVSYGAADITNHAIYDMAEETQENLAAATKAKEAEQTEGQKPSADVEKTTQTGSPDIPSGGKINAGMSAGGTVLAGIGLKNALAADDMTGVTISTADMIVSAADLMMDTAAAFGKTIAPFASTLTKKANFGVMVADGLYQISREEGVDNKFARGAAVAATTGSAIGAGTLTTTATTVGLSATTVSAATVAIPVATAVSVGVATDQAVEAYKITEELEDMFARNEQPSKSRGELEESGAPRLQNYRNLNVFAIREATMPDGTSGEDLNFRDRAKVFRDHEFSKDPDALAELKEKLEAKVEHYDNIIKENDSWVHDSVRFFWANDKIDKMRGARIEGATYKAALAELKLYEDELTQHRELMAKKEQEALTAEQAEAEKVASNEQDKPATEWEDHFKLTMLAGLEGKAKGEFIEAAKPDQAPEVKSELLAQQDANPSLNSPGMV